MHVCMYVTMYIHIHIGLLADLIGRHWQGLAAASRSLLRDGQIDRATSRRLSELDVAADVVRHIRSASIRDLLMRLELTRMRARQAAGFDMGNPCLAFLLLRAG